MSFKCYAVQCIVNGVENPQNCQFPLGFRHPAGGGPSHRDRLHAQKSKCRRREAGALVILINNENIIVTLNESLQRHTRRVAVYLKTHCNRGSTTAFPTGVLDRWHDCLLIYWRTTCLVPAFDDTLCHVPATAVVLINRQHCAQRKVPVI